MNKRKIVHIGLMKCGSTFLQGNLLPKIAEIKKLNYWKKDPILAKKIYDHYLSMCYENDSKNINLNNNDLVSFEKLVGYVDPYYWNEYAEKNLIAFGKNTHIIIVIREPIEFLSSVYLESCIHSGLTTDPKFFFLEKETWSSQFLSRKFSVNDFSYKKLISMYESKFDRISIIKFEDLFKVDTIIKLFDLNIKEKDLITKRLSTNYGIRYKDEFKNKSFSKRSVKIIIFLNRILFNFNLSLITSHVRINEIENLRNPKINKFFPEKLSFYKMLKIKISYFFNIHTYIRLFVDRFFYDEKYILDFDKLKYINIKKLKEEYDEIKTKF